MVFDITDKKQRDEQRNVLNLVKNQPGVSAKDIDNRLELLEKYEKATGLLNFFKRRKIKGEFDTLLKKDENAEHAKAYLESNKQIGRPIQKTAQQNQYGVAEFKGSSEYASSSAVPIYGSAPVITTRTHEYASQSSVSSRSSDVGVYAAFPQAEIQKKNHQKLPDNRQPSTVFIPPTPVAQSTPGVNYGQLPADSKNIIHTTQPPKQADRSKYQPLAGKTIHGEQTQKLAQQAAAKAQQKSVKGQVPGF